MVEYDRTTALIVTDVQNDFADPNGSLYVKGGEDTIAFINDEIARAEAGGALVVYTQDWHPATTAHFEKDGGIWPVHCVKESWGASFHPKLQVIDSHVIQKGSGGEDGYSAFTVRDPRSGHQTHTQLGELLHESGIQRVVVVGLATDYCVKSTALDAIAREFEVIVLREGVRAVDLQPGDGDRALEAMAAAGGRIE